MPLWRPGVEVIVASTGHAVLTIAPDIPDCRLVSLRADGFGDARDPRLIAAFAGPGGWIDCQKILMAGRGSGHPGVPPRLAGRPDLTTHPRAALAVRVRDPLRLMGYAARCRSALAVVSRGVAGLTELSAGGGGRSYPPADEKGESGGACAT